MLNIDKMYYIMDYSGNYYRNNDRDDLVIAKNSDEAAIFSFIDANKRINSGHKNKFYLLRPVEESHEVYQDREIYETETLVQVNDLSVPVLEYDISQVNWKEYLMHFSYVIEALGGYRDSLIKAESDVDLKICDILHYIELCDTSEEEAASLVDLLKECREHRRDVKDEIICLDTFQRTVGTSANLAKAKEAIKAIKGLETRRYTPRKLSELFEGRTVKMPTSGEKPHDFEVRKETEDMELIRRETIFDGKENDWMEFALQQAEFYRNVGQYIVNIRIDIEEIQQEILDLMDEIDSSNCNVAQGYKLFKRLKDLRILRKKKEQELQCLYILTGRFDVDDMANEYENDVYEMERLMYPEEVQNVENEDVSVAV